MDAVIAHYCLHKFHMLPSKFLELDSQEKAFITASIQVKLDKEKEESAKAQRKASVKKPRKR